MNTHFRCQIIRVKRRASKAGLSASGTFLFDHAPFVRLSERIRFLAGTSTEHAGVDQSRDAMQRPE
jgi:hypothetical protein